MWVEVLPPPLFWPQPTTLLRSYTGNQKTLPEGISAQVRSQNMGPSKAEIEDFWTVCLLVTIPGRCAVCGFGGATRMSDRNVGFHNLALCRAQMGGGLVLGWQVVFLSWQL